MLRGFHRLAVAMTRHDAGETPGEHRLARTGRPTMIIVYPIYHSVNTKVRYSVVIGQQVVIPRVPKKIILD